MSCFYIVENRDTRGGVVSLINSVAASSVQTMRPKLAEESDEDDIERDPKSVSLPRGECRAMTCLKTSIRRTNGPSSILLFKLPSFPEAANGTLENRRS